MLFAVILSWPTFLVSHPPQSFRSHLPPSSWVSLVPLISHGHCCLHKLVNVPVLASSGMSQSTPDYYLQVTVDWLLGSWQFRFLNQAQMGLERSHHNPNAYIAGWLPHSLSTRMYRSHGEAGLTRFDHCHGPRGSPLPRLGKLRWPFDTSLFLACTLMEPPDSVSLVP